MIVKAEKDMNAKNKLGISGCIETLRSQLGATGITAMTVAMIAVIGAGYLANVPSILLGEIVDTIVIAKSSESIWPIFGLIVACLMGRVMLVVFQKYLVERTAVGVQMRVFMQNVRKTLSVDVNELQHMRVGETTARLEKRTHGTIRCLKLIFLEAFPQLAIAIPALALAFTQSVLAGTVMLIVLLLSALVTFAQIASQKGIRIALINKAAGLSGHVAELLAHLDYVRAAGMTDHVTSRLDQEADEMRKVEFLHHKWMMGFDAAKSLIEDAGLAVVIGVGIFQTVSGDMTPGTILALGMLYKSAAIPLQSLHRIVDELYASVLQIDAAIEIVEAEDDPGLNGKLMPRLRDDEPIVVAHELSLVRTSQEGKRTHVLDNVSFKISPGEVVGIAGPSGCGKSTLLQTILGLFAGYDGHLRVCGHEVRDLSKHDYADLVSYGPQRPYVRQGNVRDNIIEAFRVKTNVGDETLKESLAAASLQIDLDKGLTERGSNLSPGQVQRLSLTRVFAKKQARIVLLDEATSMLDGATQAEIMERLRCHAQGRALVMVAHRLDTLRWADRILVLDSGRIVQSGTYEELAAMPGTFAELLGEQRPDRVLASA